MTANVDSNLSKSDKIYSSIYAKNFLRLAVSAACAGIPANQALAQVEEIIVTSTKREANLQDIPISVTAFTEADIVRQGFKTFSDYVGQIPSLSVVERQPGATSVLMRGCAAQGLSFSDSATTSVYLDEQPITASGYNPDPRLVDIQRVEALGGPQGTLFGDAAQCGTLRIITNKADASQLTGWVDAEGMSVENGGSGYDLSAMVNIPIIEDKLALRLVGFVAEEPGWIDNVLSDSPGTGVDRGLQGVVDPGENFTNAAFVDDDVNTANYYGGRLGLRWNATEKWTVDLNGIFQNYQLDGFADVDLNDTSPNDFSLYADTSVFPTLGEYDQIRFGTEDWEDEWYQASLTIEGDLGFADLVVTGAYFDRESSYNADSTAYLQAFQQVGDYFRTYYNADFNIYDFNGDPRSQNFDARDIESYTFEARLTSAEDSDSRWNWLGGIFYNHRELKELFISNVDNLWNESEWDFNTYTGNTPAGYYLNYSYYNANAPTTTRSNNWFSATYDTELDQWAVFGEIGFEFTENFSMTLGGRFYDIDNDYTVVQSALTGLNGGIPDCDTDYCYTGANDTGKGKDDGFVPKVNFTYAWTDQLVYFTYSEGFRRGGVNSAKPGSIYGSTPGFGGDPLAGAFHEYGSDEVSNWEVGAKSEWLDHTLRFNITAYFMEWEDIQVQVEDAYSEALGFALGTVNAPEAEIKGVETWIAWAPTESWDFTGNLSYNQGELSKDFFFPDEDGDLLAADGTDLPLMPDWKASLNAQYTFTGVRLSPYILAQYVYWGESTNSIGVESSLFVNPIKVQPDWQTVALRVGMEGERWSAVAYVDNVFNEYQEMFYNNRWAQQRLSVGQPRTYGLGFRVNFGD